MEGSPARGRTGAPHMAQFLVKPARMVSYRRFSGSSPTAPVMDIVETIVATSDESLRGSRLGCSWSTESHAQPVARPSMEGKTLPPRHTLAGPGTG